MSTANVAKKSKVAKAPARTIKVKINPAVALASGDGAAITTSGGGSASASRNRVRRIVRKSGVSENAIITMYSKFARIMSADRKSFIPEAQRQIQEEADELLSGALSVMAYRNASTITAEDVICAAKARGNNLYGAGNFLSLQSLRRHESARKKRHQPSGGSASEAASLPAGVGNDDDGTDSEGVDAVSATL